MKMSGELLRIILWLALIEHLRCDYYSSVSGLEKLLEVEKHYLESLEKHVQAVEHLNKAFERYLAKIEHGNHSAHYYEDPVNAFKALRRIVVDWKYADVLTLQIQNLNVYNKSEALSGEVFTPPTIDDLRGAASGLSRLQHIYKLNSTDIAKGYLKGKQYSTPMTAVNCFTLGQNLYELGEYQYASDWLIEALYKVDDQIVYKYQEDKNVVRGKGNDVVEEEELALYPYVSPVEVLEVLGPALYSAGNRRLAMAMTYQLLEMDPENKNALANKVIFKKGLKEEQRRKTLTTPPVVSDIQRLYEQVCSGEQQQTPQEKRHLRCRYVTNNVPYYLVGPLKREELNSDPLVVVYHEAIHDSEIDEIITMAQGSIERSQVGYVDDPGEADFRISKNTWLNFGEDEFLNRISQRLEDITGLSIVTGESLQVANYGIGGFYGTHFDFSDRPEDDYPEEGNRILTAMFYINDVELGGATAFPILRLAVPPIRRSLLVWYNLHKSLEPDYRTSHAGCPVLKGSKWISNEWFHAVGQEFKRPCDLAADGHISKPYEIFGLD